MRTPLAVSLVALLLAGCFSEAPPADAPADDENATVASDDAAPVDDGSAPMATDVGHMPHMHDYWSGKERVTLVDDVIDPSANEDPFAVFGGVPSGQLGGAMLRFPDGAVVMEGTGQMDFTPSWDDPLVTSVGYAYRIGAGDWSEAAALANGETSSLPITPEMTDMPHMTTSRWEFVFFPGESPGAMMGPFDLKIEIVKMRDIMMFPGHPELFEGKPEKTLHDLDHKHEEASYAKRAPNVVTQGEFGEKIITLTELVPMETKAIRFEVTILEATSMPGEVANIRFFYHGADTSFLGHPYVNPFEGSLDEGFLVYQLPVLPEQTDSPYSNASQWTLFVEPTSKFSGQEDEPDCGGCADVTIKYHVKAIAYDHELDAYSTMEGGDSASR